MVSWSARQNTQQWLAQMYRVPQLVKDEINKTNEKAAKQVGQRVKGNIPVHPKAPHLKDTIVVAQGDARLLEWTVDVGNSSVPYAGPLEYGHRTKQGAHVPAVKFFWPVVRIVNKLHRQRMRRAIRKAVKTIFGGP
jgi:hypothetical protein